MLNQIIRFLFLFLVIKPLSLFILGLNIKGQKNLPRKGPALIIANHNSHLDTIVVMSLFPIEKGFQIRPVAAYDYFCKNRFIKWFSMNIMGIIPIKREIQSAGEDPFLEVHRAFQRGEIVLFFPEGTRGEPEKMSPIKAGIFRLMKGYDAVPITPIVLTGLGKALPRCDALFVPFHVNVDIGEAFFASSTRLTFIEHIKRSFAQSDAN